MHVLQSKKNLQLKQLITNCQLQRPNHSSYFGQILTKHEFLDYIIYARELVLKNFEINSILSSNQNNVIIINFYFTLQVFRGSEPVRRTYKRSKGVV